MKCWAAAVLMAVAGCKLPAHQAAPAPDACRVDLDRLVASHPRWPEMAAIDARVKGLRARLARKLPEAREAQLPPRLDAVPEPPAVQPPDETAALREFTRLADARVARRGEELAQRNANVITEARAGLEASVEAESRQRAAEEGARVSGERREIVEGYQAEVTRLRLAVARLSSPSPYVELRKRQEQELAVRREELRRLTERRDTEIARIEEASERKLAEQKQREAATVPEHVARLEAEQREKRENELRTLRQDWQDRIDAASVALAEPPPGTASPPEGAALAPIAQSPVKIAPAAGLEREAVERALSGLLAQRQRLAQALRKETEARVVGIAARYNLTPRFGGGAEGLPDRTAFFAEQLGQ